MSADNLCDLWKNPKNCHVDDRRHLIRNLKQIFPIVEMTE
jgi:hypothetical protein